MVSKDQRRTQGMNTKKDIIADLRRMGIAEGDRLLLHTSYKSLGGVEGGIPTFLSACMEAVGTRGTLLLPTFTYNFLSAEAPIFDIRKTPSCVGAIPEVFRHCEGVLRSLHPTHSLAVWGADKEFFVENHHADQNCLDVNSPIYKLKEIGGKILHIGCGVSRNTILHGVEIACHVPYAFTVDYSDPRYHREYICIDEHGKTHKREFFHVFARAAGWQHDFERIHEIFPLSPHKLLSAQCYLFDATSLWDTAVQALHADPYCLARPYIP